MVSSWYTFSLPFPLTETTSPVLSEAPFFVTGDQFTLTSPLLKKKSAMLDMNSPSFMQKLDMNRNEMGPDQRHKLWTWYLESGAGKSIHPQWCLYGSKGLCPDENKSHERLSACFKTALQDKWRQVETWSQTLVVHTPRQAMVSLYKKQKHCQPAGWGRSTTEILHNPWVNLAL